ncbi:hypothetical protein VTN00DRAFT_204 [Thermoascus crustaceus]|uniref:uncharacterized protein n=1 Tax=Thermoascus crustaceus TaxID=5088 RepID=UPI0037448E8C
MSSNTPENDSRRPNASHPTRSFTRMETPNVSPFARSRAKTIQSVATPESVDTDSLPLPLSPDGDEQEAGPDVFEKRDSIDTGPEEVAEQGETPFALSQLMQDGFDELPIELISLTDRFIDSLSAKVHPSPPSIEKISDLFQEFYVRAESHIATHISTLASRINRDTSHHASAKSTRGGAQTRSNQKDGPEKIVTDHQMLTASEVAEKRKARKLLAYKRIVLEEAVERRVCEGVYDKIWRHKSSLDGIRDEKLRSKTAALSVVGIDLKDLGIEVLTDDESEQEEARGLLSAARESIMKMNDEKYPLGKLHHLTAAHKAIVDTLTHLLPSSSSADEILPTLIYSLITSPPESMNVISNMLFIQRFRSSSKVDGEAAYCLTNLEAAVSFLENVDLSSLRPDETADGQPKPPSIVSTPAVERADPFRPTKETPMPSVTEASASPEFSKPNTSDKEAAPATSPRPQLAVPSQQQRRPSNLFQPPLKVLGAANDAVRNTADQGLRNISNTLDNSFNFLFGRLREVQINQGSGDGQRALVPKTLDEARRLVTSPATILGDRNTVDEDGSIKDPDRASQRSGTSLRPEDRLMGLVGGRQTPRDRSVDSARSNGSGRKPLPPSSTSGGSIFSSASTPTPLESMKNFGNAFNPLNHIPGMIRGFSRNPPPEAALTSPAPTTTSIERSKPPVSADGASDISVSKISPPIKRFLETENAGDLKIGDVAELLEDYKRLATALINMGGCST